MAPQITARLQAKKIVEDFCTEPYQSSGMLGNEIANAIVKLGSLSGRDLVEQCLDQRVRGMDWVVVFPVVYGLL